MDELIEDSDLDAWEQQAAEGGLLLHERQAVRVAAGLLSGAVAACVAALERPTETAVLAVYAEACRRAQLPGETPIRDD